LIMVKWNIIAENI